MKKYIILFAGLVLVEACHESLEDKAERETKEITAKTCPQNVGNGMSYDSLTFDRSRRELRYHYTIEGEGDDSVTFSNKKELLRETMLEQFRKDLSKQRYKDAGFSIGVTIYSKKNTKSKLFDTTYTSKELK